MPTHKIVDFPAIKAACRRCSVQQLCLPQGLESADIERLEELIERPRPLRRGDYLFRQGERFRSLYAVRSGTFKTTCLAEDGSEKVLGFHLPGELLGLVGLGTGRYRATANALDTASVCELPYARLQELADHLPSLNHQLYQVMSRRIARDREVLLLLGDKSAQERLATFLLDLSQRFGQRGLSAHEFQLSMARQDIANYLGLTLETVSRTLTRFQKGGLLAVNHRHIRILDRKRLKGLVGPYTDECSSLVP